MGKKSLETLNSIIQELKRRQESEALHKSLSKRFFVEDGGQAPIEKKEHIKLSHYSPTQGLKEIDPNLMGSGNRGAEFKSAIPETPVSYFYRHGSEPEPIIAQGAKSKYDVVLHPDTKLYDMADPSLAQKLIGAGHTVNPGLLTRDEHIKAIKDHGYHGFYNSKSPLSHAVALFYKNPVTAESPHGLAKNAKSDSSEVATIALMRGDSILMGKRRDNGRYTKPGGHLNTGEDKYEGAIRELYEEAGIKVNKEDLKFLGSKSVTTRSGKKKMIHAFKTQYKGDWISTENDPDNEVIMWKFIDCSEGIPKEICENSHTPIDGDICFQLMKLKPEKLDKAEHLRKTPQVGEIDNPEDWSFAHSVGHYLNHKGMKLDSSRQIDKNLHHHVIVGPNSSTVHILSRDPHGEDPIAHMQTSLAYDNGNGDKAHRVDSSVVAPEYRNQGYGKKLYGLAADHSGNLESDSVISPEANRVWQSMAKNPKYTSKLDSYPGDEFHRISVKKKEEVSCDDIVPDFFNEDCRLNPSIREKLLGEYTGICKDLNQKGYEIHPSFVVITGSLLGPNFDDKSDLDFHIGIDFSNAMHYGKAFKDFLALYAKDFNSNKYKIHDRDLELYFQDSDENHVAPGIYDIVNDHWIKPPSHKKIVITDEEKLTASEYLEKVKDLCSTEAKDKSLLDSAQELYSSIKSMRKMGMLESGEESFGNQVFKLLRRNGALDKLTKLMHDIRANELNKSEAADKESEQIKLNKEKPEAKQSHKFKAAEWTHPNGHPRCIICGDEERTDGTCSGLSKSEDLEKGKNGDWQQEGYRLEHKVSEVNPMTGFRHHTIGAFDRDGRHAGHFKFAEHMDRSKGNDKLPELRPSHVELGPNHKRKGLATAAYSMIEGITGKKLGAGWHQTEAAKKLWAQPNKPFGKSEDLQKSPQEAHSINFGVSRIMKYIDQDLRADGTKHTVKPLGILPESHKTIYGHHESSPANGKPVFHHIVEAGDGNTTSHFLSLSEDPNDRTGLGPMSAMMVDHYKTLPSYTGHPEVNLSASNYTGLGLGSQLYKQALKHHGSLASDSMTTGAANKTWEKLGKDPEVTVNMAPIGESARHIAKYTPNKVKPTMLAGGKEKLAASEDKIPGGLSDDKAPSSFNPKSIKQGVKVEMEHTSDPKIAHEIARDHLTEDKKYYDKLAIMEGKSLSSLKALTSKDSDDTTSHQPMIDTHSRQQQIKNKPHFSQSYGKKVIK